MKRSLWVHIRRGAGNLPYGGKPQGPDGVLVGLTILAGLIVEHTVSSLFGGKWLGFTISSVFVMVVYLTFWSIGCIERSKEDDEQRDRRSCR